MQNSSIEVRVRGQQRNGQNISYVDVDLRPYLKDGGTIQGYSGKIVGGYAGCGWGEGFEENKGGGHGFPGLIIDRTLFASVNPGFSIQTLNVEIKTLKENDKVKPIDGGYIVGQQVTSAQFDGVNMYVPNKLEISAVDGNAGVLVPSAVNSSFRNISFNFEDEQIGADPIVILSAQNAGLIAGQIEQSSIYDAVKVQNISISRYGDGRQNKTLMQANVGTNVADANVGLYVGKISGHGGAGLVADIKAPEKTAKSTSEEDVISVISVSGSANNLNFGGYFGQLSVSTTSQVSFNKTQNYTQKLILETNCEVKGSANIGGIVGNANITRFSTAVSAQSGDKTLLNTDLKFSQDVANLNAGLMFGKTETGNTISIANTGDSVKGSISSTFVVNNDKSTQFGNSNIGGLIGENAANVTISDITLSFEAYKGIENKSNKKIDMTEKFSPISTQRLNFGGFIGKNDGDLTIKKDAEKEILYNQSGENVAFTSTGDVNAGDAIGLISGGGNVFINDFNSEAVNYFETSSILNVGGIVGQINGGAKSVEIKNENTTSKNIISNSNNFINAATVNAGGIVGNIAEASSLNVEGTVFGGAFKFFGAKNNTGTHHVGGILGEATVSSTCSLSNNITYGDAIYSYKGADFNLAEYYFGGVIGKVGDTTSNRASNLSLGGNVVAFTNNNPRLASMLHDANAMVGNGQAVAFDVENENIYCSQLVLAVSDNATDLGYNAKAKGYGETSAETTILGKIGLSGDAKGSKLNPISNGKVPSGEGAENSNSNGIVYYDCAQPEKQGDNFAFIGNFSASNGGSNYAPLTEVGEHSFVSGMVVKNTLEDNSPEVQDSRENIGGVVDKLSGGIVYACSSNGSLSVGGTNKKNVGGIVGLMNGGLVAESYSSVNIVYRAVGVDATNTAAEEETSTGTATAAGVAVTAGENNFFDATYSTGNVQSYISSNLYAFTNGEGATIRNSYTISWVSHKDHTKKAVASGMTGVFGDADVSKDGVWYDANAVELSSEDNGTAIEPVLYSAENNNASVENGWSKARDVNYGYPTRNFNVFQTSTVEEIEDKTYHLVPNATKLGQITGDDKNFKLTRDIDFDKSTEVSAKEVTGIFDGNNKTIRGVKNTLFTSVATLKNLRVEAIEKGGMEGSAVVADNVGTADNVIATGVLNGTGETVGGLFAEATGVIRNCKNYVKIENTNATTVGGVVGKAEAAVENCVNFSPINSTKVGAVVGGVVGNLDGNISYCGNENTVFSGYTSGGNGNYTAGGVVGNMASGSVSSCYNTSMVKAGNKSINATGASKAIAGGIVGKGSSSSISGCINEGFVEALGANGTFDSFENISIKPGLNGYSATYSFEERSNYGTSNTNVQALSMVGSGEKLSSENNDNNSNQGTIFNNGAYGNSATLEGYEWYISREQSVLNLGKTNGEPNTLNGIEISSTAVPVIAETDALGGAKTIYLKITRRLKYPGLTEAKSQILYTDIHTFESTYETQAYAEGVVKKGSVSGIKNTIETSSFENPDSVKIGGKYYAFVSSGAEFLSAINAEYEINTGVEFTGTLGGKTIKELYDFGYKFGVEIIGDNEANASGTTSIVLNGENAYLQLTFRAKANVAFKYKIVATKEDVDPIEVVVPHSNLEKVEKDGTTYIEIKLQNMNLKPYDEKNKAPLFKFDEYDFKANEPDGEGWQTLTHEVGENENADDIIEALSGNTFTIDAYLGYDETSELRSSTIAYIPVPEEEKIADIGIPDGVVGGEITRLLSQITDTVTGSSSGEPSENNLVTGCDVGEVKFSPKLVQNDSGEYELQTGFSFESTVRVSGKVKSVAGKDEFVLLGKYYKDAACEIGSSEEIQIGHQSWLLVDGEGDNQEFFAMAADTFVKSSSYDERSDRTTITFRFTGLASKTGGLLLTESGENLVSACLKGTPIILDYDLPETVSIGPGYTINAPDKTGVENGVNYKHYNDGTIEVKTKDEHYTTTITNDKGEEVESHAYKGARDAYFKVYYGVKPYNKTEVTVWEKGQTGDMIYSYDYYINDENRIIPPSSVDRGITVSVYNNNKPVVVKKVPQPAKVVVTTNRDYAENLDVRADLFERKLMLVSTSDSDIKTSSAGKVTLFDNNEYTIQEEDGQIKLTRGSEEYTADGNNVILVNGAYYSVGLAGSEGEATTNYIFIRTYLGNKGQIQVGGASLKYRFNNDNKISIGNSDFVEEDEIYKIGSVNYTIRLIEEKLDTELEFTAGENANGKLEVVVRKAKTDAENEDLGFKHYEKIEVSYKDESAIKETSVTLVEKYKYEQVVYDCDKSFIEEVKIDGNIDSEKPNKVEFETDKNEKKHTIEVSYKSFESSANETTLESKEEGKVTYSGIVLENDVDLQNVTTDQTGTLDITISGDNHIVNYYTEQKRALFTGIDPAFVKNLAVAGTVYRDTINGLNNEALSILASSSAQKLENVKTYGSISLGRGVSFRGKRNTESSYKSGLTAGEIKNSSNISNFASYSLFDARYDGSLGEIGMNGITANADKVTGDLFNYGTLIGAKGKDGFAAGTGRSGGEGKDGQSVYAISSSNVKSANSYNYGIVRAGDGGKGGRGGNGAGGKDTTSITRAPTNGTSGKLGGNGGKAGIAYLYGGTKTIAEVELNGDNSKNVYNADGGDAGARGNDGWGGLNLCSHTLVQGSQKRQYWGDSTGNTKYLFEKEAYSNATRETSTLHKIIFRGIVEGENNINYEINGDFLDFTLPNWSGPLIPINHTIDIEVYDNNILYNGKLVFAYKTGERTGYLEARNGTDLKFYMLNDIEDKACAICYGIYIDKNGDIKYGEIKNG